METNEFKKGKYCDFEAITKIKIWDNIEETEICVHCDSMPFEDILPLINNLLQFLEENKSVVGQALSDGDLLEYAEKLVKKYGEEDNDSTEERPCYLIDDTKVYLPITEEDLTNSLHFGGMIVYYHKNKSDISANILINCEPDYFAGGTIEFFMDSKGNIRDIGLME